MAGDRVRQRRIFHFFPITFLNRPDLVRHQGQYAQAGGHHGVGQAQHAVDIFLHHPGGDDAEQIPLVHLQGLVVDVAPSVLPLVSQRSAFVGRNLLPQQVHLLRVGIGDGANLLIKIVQIPQAGRIAGAADTFPVLLDNVAVPIAAEGGDRETVLVKFR